jgi:hypothetical protein
VSCIRRREVWIGVLFRCSDCTAEHARLRDDKLTIFADALGGSGTDGIDLLVYRA